MNMCHQAMDLGLGTCMIGVHDLKKLTEGFGLPEGTEVRIVLAVGYAAPIQTTPPKVRKPLDEVCSFNHW